MALPAAPSTVPGRVSVQIHAGWQVSFLTGLQPGDIGAMGCSTADITATT
jgi:hypothetical protein